LKDVWKGRRRKVRDHREGGQPLTKKLETTGEQRQARLGVLGMPKGGRKEKKETRGAPEERKEGGVNKSF